MALKATVPVCQTDCLVPRRQLYIIAVAEEQAEEEGQMKDKSIKASNTGAMVGALVSAVAVAGFTTLLWLDRIGQAAYCFLLAGTALTGLVLAAFDRLGELDLKNMRIVLHEIRQARDELLISEQRLRHVALPIVKMLAFSSAAEGRFGSAEGVSAKRAWCYRTIDQLAVRLDFTAADTAEVQKYIRLYKSIDQLFEQRSALPPGDPDRERLAAQASAISSQLVDMLKNDTEKIDAPTP